MTYRSRPAQGAPTPCSGVASVGALSKITEGYTMATATQTDQLHFGSNAFAKHRHACAFFHSDDQEHRVLLPFVKEGFERGERAFHIIDPQHRTEYTSRLASSGVPVSSAEQTGQFELRDWQEAYLRDGHFDQNRMLSLIQEVLDDGKKRGYPLTRLIAHMEWALEDRPGVNDIVEYEARLNYVLPKYRDPVICTYDLAKFGGSVVVDIMRTHPVIILGDVIQENPFYVEPDAFLDEMKTRTTPKRHE
jgi:hypothetical protein